MRGRRARSGWCRWGWRGPFVSIETGRRRIDTLSVRVSGALLLLAGGYLVYYWLSIWPILRR